MWKVFHQFNRQQSALALLLTVMALLSACTQESQLAAAAAPSASEQERDYLIGPGDTLQVFVWQNPELSVTVPVRPDGRISLPLLQDVSATQKTPAQLAQDIKNGLSTYLHDPNVTVIVTEFVGPYSQQVRVIGEAAEPKAIPYRTNMSVLDVMISVGGLTQFAAGNRAVIVRNSGGQQQKVPVRLDDLLKDGDVSANVPIMPGDVLVIPQSWF
jgi:polysaccharide export outer membrane protein